jgi:hypothetical protein
MNNLNNTHVAEIDLANISADGEVFGIFLPKKSIIVSAYLKNGANIAQSDTDKAVVTLQNGATVLATHSTALTGGTGALTANVPAAMTMASSEAQVAAGSYLKAVYDESGTYAMSGAKLIVEYCPM